MQTDASSETIELVTTDDIEQSNRGGPTSSSGDSRFRHPWHLPYAMVAALLAHTGVGLQYNITFVVSVFIVRHFLGPGADEALVGKQAGLLAAAAPCGRHRYFVRVGSFLRRVRPQERHLRLHSIAGS